MKEVSVLCASGSMAVTPFHEDSYWAGVERGVDAIVADGGSGDIGPHYLGSNAEYCPRAWEKHDLRLMLLGARRLKVPMIVGSAGGAGTNAGVDRYAELIREIAAEERLSPFSMATLYSEVDRKDLERRAGLETIAGLGAPRPLEPDDVRSCTRIVAMMGVEPLIEALDRGADVIIAGRSCDDVIFAAVPIWKGCDRGLSLHMGKTIECGPLVATPILMREAVMGTVRADDFLVEPLHPDQRCTPASVAGHTLYERLDPYIQALPGGQVDLHDVKFTAYTDRICRVTGSRWVPAKNYTVKLEGSAFVGHRAYCIFGLRDPLSIANVDIITAGITREVERQCGPVNDGNVHLIFHVYGRDAVMGRLEPTPQIRSHEICVIVEAVAPEADHADRIAGIAKYTAFRVHYPGQRSTAGGAAMMTDEVLKSSIPVYRWVVDHLLTLDDPLAPFPITLEEVSAYAKVG